MPIDHRNIDSFQTRVYMSYKNMTKTNNTTYPAVTTINITNFETGVEPLTTINVYDQWALRTTTS
jgi:hypothetical protein